MNGDRALEAELVVKKIVNTIRGAAHRKVDDHAVLATVLDVQIVFNPTGKSPGWLDHSEFLAGAGLVDNVQFSFQHEAGARCNMAMIQTAGAGIEFYDHIRRARRHVDIK